VKHLLRSKAFQKGIETLIVSASTPIWMTLYPSDQLVSLRDPLRAARHPAGGGNARG